MTSGSFKPPLTDISTADPNEWFVTLTFGTVIANNYFAIKATPGSKASRFRISALKATAIPAPEVNVPEPATLAIFGLGLAGLGYMRRRRAA